LDLACIIDGQFVIGEIKSSSNDLGKQTLSSLVELCKEIMPQRVVILVLNDKDNRLKHAVDFLNKELKTLKIEVVGYKPSNYFFEPAYHI